MLALLRDVLRHGLIGANFADASAAFNDATSLLMND
jgi:hypothetical protein